MNNNNRQFLFMEVEREVINKDGKKTKMSKNLAIRHMDYKDYNHYQVAINNEDELVIYDIVSGKEIKVLGKIDDKDVLKKLYVVEFDQYMSSDSEYINCFKDNEDKTLLNEKFFILDSDLGQKFSFPSIKGKKTEQEKAFWERADKYVKKNKLDSTKVFKDLSYEIKEFCKTNTISREEINSNNYNKIFKRVITSELKEKETTIQSVNNKKLNKKKETLKRLYEEKEKEKEKNMIHKILNKKYMETIEKRITQLTIKIDKLNKGIEKSKEREARYKSILEENNKETKESKKQKKYKNALNENKKETKETNDLADAIKDTDNLHLTNKKEYIPNKM